jgi:hypothetical protein
MGRTSVTTCQLDMPSLRLDRSTRCSSSTTSTTTNRMGATSAVPRVFHTMACSTTPRVTAPAKIIGRLVMPPITQAASARTRMAGPSTEPSGTPITPARMNTATKASTLAMLHTIICTRLTGMPSSAARSKLSALARTAIPVFVTRKNRARPAVQTITDASAIRSLPWKTIGGISKVKSKGDG